MTFLAHMADRVLNRPLLITPDKAQVIMSVLNGRIGVDAPSADRFVGSHAELDEDGYLKKYRSFRRTDDGVGVISIVGSLVNRGAFIGASSGLVSYEGIKHQAKEAREDPGVHSVIIDIQSPGGEAVGAFEAAEQVRLLAREKKTVAVVNGMAASAAYAIASGATEIVTTPSGISGSIGVVLLHTDMSKRLEREGVSPTLIFAGAHKVDGNPFEPLSDQVQASLQAEVDSIYQMFLETVALGRGNRLTVDLARATQARSFLGQSLDPSLDAITNGLADRVGTFETVLSELSRAGRGRFPVIKRGTQMANEVNGPVAEIAGISQADHDAAVAAAEANGRKLGAEAERKRLSSVLSAEGIAGDATRMGHALDLAAVAPDLSADKIITLTTRHVGSSAGRTDGMSLEERRGDADPIGASAGAAGGEKAGIDVSAIYGLHNRSQ